MKKTIFFILIILTLTQVTVSAKEYIVKPKSDTVFLMTTELNLEPLIPQLGIYTTEDISNSDLFEFIEEDAPVELFDTYDYNNFIKKQEYAITSIKNMWDIGAYGNGVRIGVVDSGCNRHIALLNNLCSGASFVDESDDTIDNIGHGTAVSGVMAAEYGFKQCIGMSHKANIVPLKFIDKDNEGNVLGGTTKRLAQAIVAAVDDFDCDIINISSGTISSHTLQEAIDYAVSKGAVIVAAVGNDASSKYNYPATYENVIGVGSINNLKERSSFSNTNNSVFITAPGENLTTLSGIEQTMKNSGTSFSAPYVSGIIADMCTINNKITTQEIMDVISNTAEDLGDKGYDTSFGYGLIRADRIIDYMLDKCECFVSEIDVCSVDDFNEVRLRFNNITCPSCIFAEYTNGILNQINMDIQYISDNVCMMRLKKIDGGILRYFVWDSIYSMKPVKLNIMNY